MTIKIEDLTPGTVVELGPVTVERVRVDRFVDFVAGDGQRGAASLYNITRIISRPETDADKIARLERELAERDARIAELLKAANPLHVVEAEPTTPVWSDPIEGPPPKGLPAGSYGVKFSEHGGWTEGGTPSDGIYQSTSIRHRILMHQPIKWDGGECPMPGDWEMDVTYPARNGGTHTQSKVRADSIDWSKPFTFTLTSTGGGNG